MNFANVKSLVVKGMFGFAAVAAVLAAGSTKAQAQGFGVGVQFGGPAYVYPQTGYYAAPGYYDNDWARRQAFVRHEEEERREAYWQHERWEHQRDFDRDRHFDRDDHRFDGRGFDRR